MSEEKKPFHIFLGSLKEYEKFVKCRCEIVDTGESNLNIVLRRETPESVERTPDKKTRKFIEDNQVIAIIRCIYIITNGILGIPVRKKIKSPKK